MLNRRDALKLAALAPVGAAASTLLAPRVDGAKRKLEIRSYRTLGRTGQKISDLSLGGGDLPGPGLVRRALQMGITYIDTGADYGPSEGIIGRGWKSSGVGRDKFHLTTKICATRYPGHKTGVPAKRIISWLEGSLKRLRTDYVDNLFIHAIGELGPNDVERLKEPEMLEAVYQLKKQGKIRFLGCSSHGPHKPLECLLFAIESGLYDVIMPAYNIYKWPGLDQVLKLAHQRGVGVIAMKTLRGGLQAKQHGVLPRGSDFAHSAFKWVWSNPAVAGLIVTMQSVGKLEHYMAASGGKLASVEKSEMSRMFAATSTSVCRIGCGDCLPRCSAGVEVPTVLRQDMYYTDYAAIARARSGYARLTQNGVAADRCLSCAAPTCLDACTYGVPIRQRLLEAHQRLG